MEMLRAKILWSDFPLTYNFGSAREASSSTGIPIDGSGFLDVVIGHGRPSEDRIEQVRRYYANDVYSPNAKNPDGSPCEFDAFSVETERLVGIEEVE